MCNVPTEYGIMHHPISSSLSLLASHLSRWHHFLALLPSFISIQLYPMGEGTEGIISSSSKRRRIREPLKVINPNNVVDSINPTIGFHSSSRHPPEGFGNFPRRPIDLPGRNFVFKWWRGGIGDTAGMYIFFVFLDARIPGCFDLSILYILLTTGKMGKEFWLVVGGRCRQETEQRRKKRRKKRNVGTGQRRRESSWQRRRQRFLKKEKHKEAADAEEAILTLLEGKDEWWKSLCIRLFGTPLFFYLSLYCK